MLYEVKYREPSEPFLDGIRLEASESDVLVASETAHYFLRGWHTEGGAVTLYFKARSLRRLLSFRARWYNPALETPTVTFYEPIGETGDTDYSAPMLIVIQSGSRYYIESVLAVHAARVVELIWQSPLEQLYYLTGAVDLAKDAPSGKVVSEGGVLIPLSLLPPNGASESCESDDVDKFPQIFTTS